ncbi:MAG TPA: ATP-dependent Clp protease adaptor ClpS [Phycisphaerae bacterium]|nr:ATP-dependent Clp protease adaptor ClpS [Phycisphaerae bacterium]
MAEETKPASPGQQAGSTQTAGPVADRKPATEPPRLLPPWKVILHNDDKNDFDHVIKTIRRLTPLGKEEAILRTLEAHKTGAALLLVTHHERAELYIDQFASCGLTVTAEPEA